MEWRRNTRHVRWSVEFGVYSDTTEDTNWLSGMIELVTEDVYFSTTIGWTSKRTSLSNSWWVEEDEFNTIRHILVVQCQLQEH